MTTEAIESAATESVVAALASPEPKLWAGKYKTPEELESAYKNVAGTYEENKEIKKKLEEVTRVPEKYEPPQDVHLRDAELKEIISIAKNAGLTQQQFERTAREMQSRIQSNIEVIENNKKEIGEEKLTIIQDYVKKYYPENLQSAVFNQILKDKNAMSDALKDRDARLNSQAPGMNQAGSGAPQKYDGQKDLYDAAEAYRKNPNAKTRAKYIDIARQTGDERFKDQS